MIYCSDHGSILHPPQTLWFAELLTKVAVYRCMLKQSLLSRDGNVLAHEIKRASPVFQLGIVRASEESNSPTCIVC